MKINDRLLGAAIAAALALSAASCASSMAYSRAVDSLRSGDRTAAVLAAAESLSHSPKNYKALALLEEAFPAAVAEKKAAATAAAAAGGELRWEGIARDWEAIRAMNDAVGALPPLFRKGAAEPVAFSYEDDRGLLAEARERAAEHRYAEGVRLLAVGRRAEARAAYESFRKALAFRPGYEDAAALASQARELGSDRIAVIPFDSRLRDLESQSFVDMLYGSCQSSLVQASKDREFVRVVERARLEAVLAEHELSASELANARFGPESVGLYGANILAFGQLLAFSSEYPQVRSRSESFKVEVDEPIKDAAPVNGVVPSKKVLKSVVVTIFTKRSSVAATVAYRAVDIETSVVLEARTVADSMHDERQWAVWTGDKEAIPARYASLTEQGDGDIQLPGVLMPRLAARMNGVFAEALLRAR